MAVSLMQTFVDASLHILHIGKVNVSRNNDIAQVIRALDLSPVNLALALVFLQRYSANAVNTLDASESENLPYYIIVASLVLANKYLNDQSYTLKLWLSILRKCLALLSSLSLLNQMETHMLSALNYLLTASHDPLLWKQLSHLDSAGIHKLRVAAECEKPGAFYASCRGVKRSAVSPEPTLYSKKSQKVFDQGIMSKLTLSQRGPATHTLGLATPPSSVCSPFKYQTQRVRMHKNSSSMPSYSVPAFPPGYPVAPNSVVLPSTFVPPVPQLNNNIHTPASTSVPVVNGSGFASVYATPCSLLNGPFTPRTYTGAYTPINYTLGASMNSTPSINGNLFTPTAFTTAGVPFFVNHPSHAQTPGCERQTPMPLVNNGYGNISFYGNLGSFGSLTNKVMRPTSSYILCFEYA